MIELAEPPAQDQTPWRYADLPVHPVAALFPMMTDEELDDLAADIRQNGLLHPIVLDQHGTLIDGRNRLEGCRRANREPDFTQAALEDPVAFILSANVHRRHLSKGQAAMAVAGACKQSLQMSTREAALHADMSHQRIHQAQVVLDYASELAPRVLAGDLMLNEAYAAAMQSKRARGAAEEEAKQYRADLARLRDGAPDLAAQVEDHRLGLKAAIEELDHRIERDQQRRDAALQLLHRGIVVFNPNGAPPEQRACELAFGLEQIWVGTGSDAFALLPDGSRLTEQRLAGCLAVLHALYDRVYGGAGNDDK